MGRYKRGKASTTIYDKNFHTGRGISVSKYNWKEKKQQTLSSAVIKGCNEISPGMREKIVDLIRWTWNF